MGAISRARGRHSFLEFGREPEALDAVLVTKLQTVHYAREDSSHLAMAENLGNTVYKNAHRETTQWDDAQRALGNFRELPPEFKPDKYSPEAEITTAGKIMGAERVELLEGLEVRALRYLAAFLLHCAALRCSCWVRAGGQ